MIDTICFFAESEPRWIFAELEEGFDHFNEYKADGGHDPATDPAASVYIHFANGVRAFYNSIKIEMPGSQHELICEKGQITVSDRDISVIRGTSHSEWGRTTVAPDEYWATFQLDAVAELIHVLEHGGRLVSPGQEGRKTLEIMLAILKSQQLSNDRVNLPLG